MIDAGDVVIQIRGPCEGHAFIVDVVDGNLLYVRLARPYPPYNGHPGWSHRDYYRELSPRERGDEVWIPNVGWVVKT